MKKYKEARDSFLLAIRETDERSSRLGHDVGQRAVNRGAVKDAYIEALEGIIEASLDEKGRVIARVQEIRERREKQIVMAAQRVDWHAGRVLHVLENVHAAYVDRIEDLLREICGEVENEAN